MGQIPPRAGGRAHTFPFSWKSMQKSRAFLIFLVNPHFSLLVQSEPCEWLCRGERLYDTSPDPIAIGCLTAVEDVSVCAKAKTRLSGEISGGRVLLLAVTEEMIDVCYPAYTTPHADIVRPRLASPGTFPSRPQACLIYTSQAVWYASKAPAPNPRSLFLPHRLVRAPQIKPHH